MSLPSGESLNLPRESITKVRLREVTAWCVVLAIIGFLIGLWLNTALHWHVHVYRLLYLATMPDIHRDDFDRGLTGLWLGALGGLFFGTVNPIVRRDWPRWLRNVIYGTVSFGLLGASLTTILFAFNDQLLLETVRARAREAGATLGAFQQQVYQEFLIRNGLYGAVAGVLFGLTYTLLERKKVSPVPGGPGIDPATPD